MKLFFAPKICKWTLIFCFTISISFHSKANEGMWIPLLLNSLNESDMQSLGMKMSAEDIYSVNKGSLKDAIVHFGGFCTAEVVSNQGLILTNHHCGYSEIQSHSTLEKNYLKNGFWAMDKSQELPNDGLYAQFIVRIEDVTDKVFKGVKNKMDETEKQSLIDKNIDVVESGMTKESYQDVFIRPFFKGNQYFAFITETYTDVRLVGAPPESIGKFGADTDNWVWPRHTGDFSIFRIYAGPDNKPASYSPDNKPYEPKHFLPISIDGVEADDFSMVFGFPGRTNQYLPSYAVQQIMDVIDPAKIAVRDVSLSIMSKYMRADEGTRLAYSSKFAGIANGWKKWIGESQGLRSTGAVGKKIETENIFTKRLSKNRKLNKQYGQLLPEFKQLYQDIEPYAEALDYYNEVLGRNVEIFRIASSLNRLINAYENNGQAGYELELINTKNYIDRFYSDYNSTIDGEIYTALVKLISEKLTEDYLAPTLQNDHSNSFANSLLSDPEILMKSLTTNAEETIAELKKDPIQSLYRDILSFTNEEIAPNYTLYNDKIVENMKLYMAGLMEVFPEQTFWPDANSTLRISYGQIDGYEPKDAVVYHHVSYLKGVVEKYVPGDYEFDVDSKLLDLYGAKDYGDYGENGKMPVCFIGKNHTSGGNSGSPAIDAYGNLIGINFDRVWEGTMSDISYDPSICRNIMVDIRYVLFVIDKFAGAKHLVDEMTLVHPKK